MTFKRIIIIFITILVYQLNSLQAQTTCKNGLGRVLYERLPNQQLQGYDDDVVRDTAPPFRVLEKCQDLCLRDRTGTNNLVRTCTSFDFQPGSRITSFGGTSEYEESLCYLTSEQAGPEGIGSLMLVPNSVHFNEICLTSSRPERECPSRRYVFERHSRKKLKLPISDIKEITAANRSDCEDKCLNEFSFVCRSANFDASMRSCSLSRYFAADRYPTGERYPGDRYGNRDKDYDRGRYPALTPEEDRYPQDYERDRYPDRYPGDRNTLPMDRYPDNRDRYPGKGYNRLPINDDRFPTRDRYADRYPEYYGNRYGDRDRERYPDRFGNRDRERYPDRFGDRERYPFDDRYPVRDRYPIYRPFDRIPALSNNGLPSDLPHTRPYAPGEDNQYRPFGPGGRYPDDRYASRYPTRYPPSRGEPVGGYSGRDSSDPIFPDKRYRPSSYDSRYPLVSGTRDRPPTRYPPDDIIISARRPEPESAKRYPPAPAALAPPIKYPTTPNRFPVGNERYPIEIYKYGNRYGGERAGRPGYDRPPPAYDYDYEERYNDRIPMYDREYENRRPLIGGPGFPYESPFNRPYHAGGSIIPAVDDRPLPGGHSHPPHPPAPSYSGGSGISNGGGGGFSRPPIYTRCEESDNFKQVAARHKMRRNFVRRVLIVPSLIQCERECIESRDFTCRSFNYRDSAASNYDERDLPNCELSDRDSRDLDVHDPNLFDASNYDFYERGLGRSDNECMDVTQNCNEEGMEFTIRTPEGFFGRIYTYGYYDRCFFRGNGAPLNVLRISAPQGFPDCGTQRYGDTLSNIVVVQFSDNVQTSRDKRYNLTCVFRGPGEAIVTSGYIGAGSGSPIPIEYLPAENTLSSKVRLSILYQGRPTTTIAVGDPLTFRLEAQDGYNHITDIFATNVVARDPYSGRSIQLIDRFGCPVDPYVFPELDKLRDGDTLEARFNAFKIPESNFLVFEATVRTCRDGCQPAYCPSPAGRQEPSFGRRRRSLNDTNVSDTDPTEIRINGTLTLNGTIVLPANDTNTTATTENSLEIEEPEQVREMIEVFETREEIENEVYPRKLIAPVETVCMSPSEYHGLISAVIMLMILLFSITMAAGLAYRRYWATLNKNRLADRHSPVNSFGHSSIRTHERFSELGHMQSSTASTNTMPNRSANAFRANMNIFGGSLHKTFATGNLARMCQLPVMNPMRSNAAMGLSNQFEDPSEPIYTDPSLFERSRSLRSMNMEVDLEAEDNNDNH